MTLQVSIESSPSGVSVVDSTRTFSEEGGTIGRAANCSWQLEDPERFLSGLHCEISFNGSGFTLIDNSTNGTFINGNPEPIGKGASVPLADGDIFEVGDYKLKVAMWGVAGSPSHTQSAMSDPFATPESSEPFGGFASPSASPDPFGAAAPVTDAFTLDPTPEETDPLAMFDSAKFDHTGGASDDIFGVGGASVSDASGMNDAISWPEATPENHIPEDWGSDFDLLADEPSPIEPLPIEPSPQPAPVKPSPGAQQPQPAMQSDPLNLGGQVPSSMPLTDRPINKPVFNAGVNRPTPEPTPAQPASPVNVSAASQAQNDALINAMGLDPKALGAAQKMEISVQVGALMRDVVEGMMQMLRSRASIKNEFRMDVTTIQPAENNPLKFSVDVDEALENMFVRKSTAYKNADQAFLEGFSGIAEHQMAIIAGIREAFEGMIKRFDPKNLENQFDARSKGSIIPGAKNAKNWANYEKFYADLNNNLDNSFQFLFGDEFVQAYEEQLRKLAIARQQK